MSTEQEDRPASVWHEVRTWPARARLALASRILQSLEQEPPSRSSAVGLIGLWRTDRPPTDEEIDRIVEEERLWKHG